MSLPMPHTPAQKQVADRVGDVVGLAVVEGNVGEVVGVRVGDTVGASVQSMSGDALARKVAHDGKRARVACRWPQMSSLRRSLNCISPSKWGRP